MEIFAKNVMDLLPNPEINEIQCIFFHISNPKADIISNHFKMKSNSITGMIIKENKKVVDTFKQ